MIVDGEETYIGCFPKQLESGSPTIYTEIDKNIRSLVRLLFKLGIKTYSSCSGHPEDDDYGGYISMKYDIDTVMLLNVVMLEMDKFSIKKFPVDPVNIGDKCLHHHQLSTEIIVVQAGERTGELQLVLRWNFVINDEYTPVIFHRALFNVFNRIYNNSKNIPEATQSYIDRVNEHSDPESMYILDSNGSNRLKDLITMRSDLVWSVSVRDADEKWFETAKKIIDELYDEMYTINKGEVDE